MRPRITQPAGSSISPAATSAAWSSFSPSGGRMEKAPLLQRLVTEMHRVQLLPRVRGPARRV